MASNDQAILAEWSKQRDNEDGDEWRWRLGNPPNDICKAYCRVANAANLDHLKTNGILDSTEPVRRNDALDLLKFSGRSFSNG